jgi:hypothetical protein
MSFTNGDYWESSESPWTLEFEFLPPAEGVYRTSGASMEAVVTVMPCSANWLATTILAGG